MRIIISVIIIVLAAAALLSVVTYSILTSTTLPDSTPSNQSDALENKTPQFNSTDSPVVNSSGAADGADSSEGGRNSSRDRGGGGGGGGNGGGSSSSGGEVVEENYSFGLPMLLMAVINTQNPINVIADNELNVLASKIDMISGLDGHGYDFPGAITKFREKNSTMKVLCYASTMELIPANNDDRTKRIDIEEDSFFHSADPASLRVIAYGGTTRVWFKQDARARQAMPHYTPPGVDYYEIEYSNSEAGPWSSLGQVNEDGVGHLAVNIGIPVYTFVDPNPVANRWYRVSTKLNIQSELVDYSWAAQGENISQAFPVVHLTSEGTFSVVYVGNGAPDVSQIIFERDSDNDRIFESGERTQATAAIQRPEYRLYYGNIGGVNRVSYRAYLSTNSSVRGPPGEDSYTRQNGYNNRIQDSFGSHIIKPNNGLWSDILSDRIDNCTNHGFDGIRLDFSYDNVELSWIANAKVSQREKEIHDSLPAHVKNLLRDLKNSHSGSLIFINGYFVFGNKSNYWGYLSEVDGADFEYFAFDEPSETEVMGSTSEAMLGILGTQQLGKIAVALTNTGKENQIARMTSTVLYLLIANENTYFWSNGGNDLYQEVPYFPEWDAPLGKPLIPTITNISVLAGPDGTLKREFENGVVYYNPGSQTVNINLDGNYKLLSVSGGYDSSVGGNGNFSYTDVTSLSLQAKRAAILIKN